MIFRQLAFIRLTVTTERPLKIVTYFLSVLLDFYSHLLLLASSLYATVSMVTCSPALYLLFPNSQPSELLLQSESITSWHPEPPSQTRFNTNNLLPFTCDSLTGFALRALFRYVPRPATIISLLLTEKPQTPSFHDSKRVV